MARRWGLVIALASAALAVTAACSTNLTIEANGTSGDGGDEGSDAGASEGGEDAAAACAATLVIDRTEIDFGEGFATDQRDQIVTLTNPTSTATIVNITYTGAGITGAASAPLVAGGKATFQVHFQFGAPGAGAGTADLRWGNGCVASLPVHGKLVTGGYAVSPLTVDFGSVLCGDTPNDVPVHIQAAPGSSSPWSASVSPAEFSLPISVGSVDGGTTDTLAVRWSSFPIPTMPLQPHQGLLTLTINNDTPQVRTINVQGTVSGAKIKFMPKDVILTAQAPTAPVNVINLGDTDVTLLLQVGAPFTLMPNTLLVPAKSAVPIVAKAAASANVTKIVSVSATAGRLCDQNTLTLFLQ